VPDDPFELLGLRRDATLAEVRAARRRLAFDRHPDRGGSADAMRELNAAFDAAVGHLTGRRPLVTNSRRAREHWTADHWTSDAERRPTTSATGSRRAAASLDGSGPARRTLVRHRCLAAEAFEALLVVTSWIGEVLVDDPPYVLEVHLYEPAACWCRLDLVPDAGQAR